MISIILPTYNSFQFLKERVDTILNQTFSDWECIVVDGFSTDGTWEYLLQYTSDPRFRYYQFKPNGVYDALNKGIELALGEYVYIATSDDTMTTQCLEKLHFALEFHKNCDLAHCCLTLIDEAGNPLTKQWKDWPLVKHYGALISKKHIRKAPYDGMVHSVYTTAYISLTQLMIRRSLFCKTGKFNESGGSTADFEWGMTASLITNTVHLPEYLATWRKRTGQLTVQEYLESKEYKIKLIKMTISAYNKASRYLLSNIHLNDLLFNYRCQYYIKLLGQKSKSFDIWMINFIPYLFLGGYLELVIKLLVTRKNNSERNLRLLFTKYGLEKKDLLVVQK